MDEKKKNLVKNLNAISLFRFHYAKKISDQIGVYRGQFPILEYIYENPSCQQNDIAKGLQVSPASIATSLKRIEKSGLVKRKTDKDNQRANVLSVTEKGIGAIKQGEELFDKIDVMQFKGFSEQELKTLGEYLNRILFNLSGREDFSFEELLDAVNRFHAEGK